MPSPARGLPGHLRLRRVLVDSERLAVAIDVRAIGALGWPMTAAEVIDRHLGTSNADVLADIEEHLGQPVPSDWDEAWNAEYRASLMNSS